VSLTRYLVGVVLLAAVVVAVGGGARSVRIRLLSAWSGPPAWLADIVLALGTIIGVGEALGALHGYRLLPMLAGTIGAGAAGFAWGRRGAAREATVPHDASAPVVAEPAAGRGAAFVCCERSRCSLPPGRHRRSPP
jgi:hypothetical protein